MRFCWSSVALTVLPGVRLRSLCAAASRRTNSMSDMSCWPSLCSRPPTDSPREMVISRWKAPVVGSGWGASDTGSMTRAWGGSSVSGATVKAVSVATEKAAPRAEASRLPGELCMRGVGIGLPGLRQSENRGKQELGCRLVASDRIFQKRRHARLIWLPFPTTLTRATPEAVARTEASSLLRQVPCRRAGGRDRRVAARVSQKLRMFGNRAYEPRF